MIGRIFTLVALVPALGALGGAQGSRQKRYLVFPEGSTFSYAFCLTVGAYTPPSTGPLVEAIAVAVSYDLPNNTMALGVDKFIRNNQPALGRMHRSNLYGMFEAILQKVGVQGRACVLRAICEAAQQLYPGLGMVPEILRTILTFSGEAMNKNEPEEHNIYYEAYRKGLSDDNCPDLYSSCPFSIINVFMNLKPLPNILK